MANPYHHAVSSARKWGGKPEDYQAIHDWFDESKMMYADFRHRALRHHAEGCFMAERIFGHTITNSNGQKIPTRLVAEQHVKEDLGRIPSVQDWFTNIRPQAWMGRTGGMVVVRPHLRGGSSIKPHIRKPRTNKPTKERNLHVT